MNYIILTLLLILCAIVYIKLAQKYNIVDNPNLRSSHTIPTIGGGGVLFFIAIQYYFVYSDFNYPYFVIGLSSIAVVSFIDDIKTLSAKIRLPFQFLAVGMVLLQTQVIQEPIWLLGLLVIIGVGFINIYNFMDGINGITGLYSFCVLVSFWLVNINTPFVDSSLISYTLLAIAVFGYYNFRINARLFSGDIGSISLAILILFLGIQSIYSLQAPVLILFIAVYAADSILTIVYRASIGESIIEAHRHHIYQKLVDTFKWSHLQVTAAYVVLQLLITKVALFSYTQTLLIQYSFIVLCALVLLVFYMAIFKMDKKAKNMIAS